LELEVLRAKYFDLFDLAPLGYITLGPDLIIKEANLAASNLLGCDRSKLIGRGISSFIQAESIDLLFHHYKRVAMGKRDPAPVLTSRTKNGTDIQIQFESNIVELGSQKGFRSILTDVTRIKETERALERANDELEREVTVRTEELQKSNAELQQFAYVASHDLQKPLRMVISYLTLLEKRCPDNLDPEAKEFIQYAVEGGKRMKDLIDDLLLYSRIDSQQRKFASVDMNTVTERTLEGSLVLINDCQAEVSVDPLPSIVGDESQLLRVMQNLVGNAVKFHGPDPPKVHISATEQGDVWTFAIQDNGIGLRMEYSDKIFQMFQRLHTRDRFPGSGVGLAIVKKIVERHGGRIWVESAEGKGATFFFTIPKGSAN
jgi:PAS domain S-box-containing protein